MNVKETLKELKETLKQEYEDLEAELTNIPEKDIEARIEIGAWMDAISWMLCLLKQEDVSRHTNEILKREGAEEIGQ